jgi:hypothetical protein
MEQIRGTGTSAKSDLYSLSATLYQLLTNSVPPDALSRADSLLNGLADPLKPLNEINKEVTPEVSKVILKGMEISQDKRHSSAREMQKSLRDAYAKLQNVMSAQTIAFNLDDEPVDGGETIPEVAEDSETPIDLAKTFTGYPEPELDSAPPVAENKSESVAQTPALPEEDFDATIKYEPEFVDPSSKQSDVQTEVFLAGDSSAIGAAQEENEISAGDSFSRQDSFPAEDDFSGGGFSTGNDYNDYDDYSENESFSTRDNYSEGESFAKAENFSPDATVPLINFDDQNEGYEGRVEETPEELEGADNTDFFSIPESGEEQMADGTASFVNVDEGYSAGETQINNFSEAESAKPSDTPAPPKKKSRAVPIILGLGAVFILIVGAVGGVAWFLLGDSDFFGFGGDKTPTPQPSVEETITPEPTREEIIENTNDADNANIDNTNADNANIDNTNGSVTPEKTTTPTTVPTQRPTARPTQRPTARPTQRPTQRPTPRPTQKPTPRPKPTINQ